MISEFDLEKLKVIEEVSYVRNKELLIGLMKAISPEIVLYETSDEMVLLEAVAYAMTYGDEKFNARMRAALPAYGKGASLDSSCLNFYGTTRLQGESDKAFYERSLASLQASVTTGSDDSYIAHTKAVDSRITHVYPYRSGEGETTIVWYSATEKKEEELTALQRAIEAVLFDTKRRSLCATRQSVVRAEVVNFDISLKVIVYSVLKKDELIYEAKEALRTFYKDYPIAYEVNLSKITSLVHLQGVAKVEIVSPATDVVIGKEQIALLGEITIVTEDLQDV